MRRMITQKMIDYIKRLQGQMSFDDGTGEIVFKDAIFIEHDGEKVAIYLDNLGPDTPVVAFDNLLVDGIAIITGDASIGGDLKVSGKMSIGTPNFSGEFELINALPEGLALDANSYLTFKIYGSIAYVVLEFGVVNSTGADISTGNIGFQVKDLPDAIAEKIIRRDGTTLKTGQDTNATISNTLGVRGTNSHICSIQSYVANRISCNVNPASISANSTSWYSFRFIITL